MDKIKKVIDSVLAVMCVAMFVLLTATTSWQVISRYLLNRPSAITEELAKIIFVWMVLLAAAYLFGEKGGHMNIGLLLDKLNGKKEYVVNIAIQISICIFSIFVLIFGGSNAVILGLSQKNASLPIISTGQIYMALPICGIFTVFYALNFIYESLKHLIIASAEERREKGNG